jgi:hypothetical protein
MQRHMLGLALIASFLVATEPLHGQVPMGRMGGMSAGRKLVRLGVGGGMSVPTSNAADAFKNGVNAQAYVLLSPPMLPTLRFNLGYQKFNFKDTFRDALLGGGAAAGDVEGETTLLSGVGGISFTVLPLGPVRTYVTAGVGAFHIKDMLQQSSGDSTSTSTRFGIDGGAGIALKLGRLEAFVEGRLQNVYTAEGWIDTKTITAIPVTFGLLF